MAHATFQDHGTTGFEQEYFQGFVKYGHGGHLNHVTNTFYVNLCPLLPRRLSIKFGFGWASDFRDV